MLISRISYAEIPRVDVESRRLKSAHRIQPPLLWLISQSEVEFQHETNWATPWDVFDGRNTVLVFDPTTASVDVMIWGLELANGRGGGTQIKKYQLTHSLRLTEAKQFIGPRFIHKLPNKLNKFENYLSSLKVSLYLILIDQFFNETPNLNSLLLRHWRSIRGRTKGNLNTQMRVYAALDYVKCN